MGLTVLEVEVANPASPKDTRKLELLVDSGAIYSVVPTEVLNELGIAPLTEGDVERMITSLTGYRILTGVRGRPPSDRWAVAKLIGRTSTLLQENPEIAELDLNPIIVHEKGLSVVDSRIILTEQE